ncbi:type II secretion system protein GspC [Flagellatimonas centrodinii]|uniref:type II secretion system protein GspC n=1 Tax=Flagellatimonas centrodinii TaxID=2806210 RepID=UPI001FED9E14|nr:type II secretion system protein GspC [Flagellatimonas centrodinii]ULQ46788.1 type II secretion system protein GspC [Flagellatimonas centrodinii]
MAPFQAFWLQHRERAQRVVPVGLTLLLSLLIGLQLARLFWWAVPPPDAWRPVPALAATAQGGPTPIDVAALANAQLFGAASVEAPSDAALADAPDTNLNLTLLGIFAGDDDADSRALIGTGNGEEQPFSIGDDVVRGATLKAIFADRVVLSRNGRNETLRLDKDAPNRAVSSSAPASTALPDRVALPQLASVREQILQDPTQAANYLRVQPAASGGTMRGYRIYPGRDRSLFNAAGLRPGDLVTGINGTELNDATRALQMLTELSTASQVSLTIERGGNAQTVNISLN